MRIAIRLHRALFVLVIMLLSGCAMNGPTWNPTDYATVHGVIRDESGGTIDDPVTVSLGRTSINTTDGTYAMGWIAPGKYIIRASSPGYEEYRRILSVPPGAQLEYTIVLSGTGEPAASADNDTSAPSVATVLTGQTIVVDPGHGGSNPSLGDHGTSGSHGVEKRNVLAVALQLRDLLEASGARVVMTRDRDVNPSIGTRFETHRHGQLKARVDLANRVGATVLVSIHNDWHSNTSAAGVRTFYYSEAGRRLAEAIQPEVVRHLGAKNRAIERASFEVIRETTMPSVLIELGFLSNPDEDYLLSTPAYRAKAAQGLHDGLVRYFQQR